MKYRIAPLISLACLCFVASFLSLSGLSFLQHQKRQVSEFKKELQNAMAESQLRLVSGVHESGQRLLSGWPGGGQDKNLLRSILEVNLSRGSLDQLELTVPETCQLYAKGKLTDHFESRCEKQIRSTELASSQDPESGLISISFVKSMNFEKNLRLNLTGYLRVDETWLQTYPRLKDLAADANIWFSPGSGRVAKESGYWMTEGTEASLWTRKPWYLPGGEAGQVMMDLLPELSIWFLLCGLGLLWICLSQSAREVRGIKNDTDHLLEWISEQVSAHRQSEPRLSDKFQNQVNKRGWNHFSTKFLKHMASIREELAEKSRVAGRLSSELDFSRSEVLCLKKQLGNIQKNQILNDQLNSSSPILNQFIENGWDGIFKSQVQFQRTCQPSVSGLSELARNWQKGLDELGSRKFVRSLAERPSARGFQHLLEEQTQALIHYCNLLKESSGQFEDCFNRADAVFQNTYHLMCHWNRLARHNDSDFEADECQQSVFELLTYVETLLRVRNAKPELTLRLDAGLKSEPCPMIPRSVFCCALQVMIDMSLVDSNLLDLISVKLKSGRGRIVLVFHTLSPEFSLNLDLTAMAQIKNILAPWGLECEFIPVETGSGYLLVSWPTHEIESQATSSTLKKPGPDQIYVTNS